MKILVIKVAKGTLFIYFLFFFTLQNHETLNLCCFIVVHAFVTETLFVDKIVFFFKYLITLVYILQNISHIIIVPKK